MLVDVLAASRPSKVFGWIKRFLFCMSVLSMCCMYTCVCVCLCVRVCVRVCVCVPCSQKKQVWCVGTSRRLRNV